MRNYDPKNHYWLIRDEQNAVYGSARDADVADPDNDTAYQAWLGRGNRPSRIASRAELEEVLANSGLRNAPVDVIGRILGDRATHDDYRTAFIALAKLVRDQAGLTNAQFRQALIDRMG